MVIESIPLSPFFQRCEVVADMGGITACGVSLALTCEPGGFKRCIGTT